MRTAIIKSAMTLLTAGSLSACYMEVHDDGSKDDDALDTRIDHPGEMPQDLQGKAQSCDQASTPQAGGQGCWRLDDYTWRTSCKTADCQAVKVFAHYMLADDIGGDRVVHVEAFDNENFQGSPVGSVRMANFAARRGEWRDGDLYLPPGEYYLRAYMSTDDDKTVPYTLGGMTLVGDEPVGVFGALSGAEMVRVAPRDQNPYPAPVHVYLDKLFEKPGSEPETNAHLRINLTALDVTQVPDGRKVRIELRQGSDLAAAPVAQFQMATETLLVQGRPGKAEFVSPSLKEGDYTVFVYLDADGNELYDDDELSQLYKMNQQPYAVAIRKNRTETISITLGTAPASTQPTAAGSNAGASSTGTTAAN